jgi:lysophospholipid hydrolase
VGLQAGRETLKKWKDEGKLPSGLVDDKKSQAVLSRGTRLRWVLSLL